MPDEMELRAWRAEVALAKGVPAGHAKRLVGNTLAEMQADADQLLADLGVGAGTGGAQQQREQVPSFDHGHQGSAVRDALGSAGHNEAVRRYGADAVATGTQAGRAPAPSASGAPREVYGRG